jgi:hypothetical protein
VSVSGEFRRVLGDCAGFLRACGAPGAEGLGRALEDARGAAAHDLSRGARRALEALEAAREAPPAFDSERERGEFHRLCDHLAAVCRAILGAPLQA